MRVTKDPAVRRQEIIKTARSLFEKQGVQKTTMSQIASQLDIAKGLVYYYFRSKDDLVRAIIDQFSDDLNLRLKKAAQQGELNFYEKMKAIFNIYFHTIRNQPALLSFSPSEPGVFALVREHLCQIALEHVETVLQQGIRENTIQIEYPQYMLRLLIYGLGDLYLDGIVQPDIHAALIEQTLGLPRGQIVFEE